MGECFFWYLPTWVVSGKGPLNGCVYVGVPASDSNSERSVASSVTAESVMTRNTLLAVDTRGQHTRGQHIKQAVNRIGDDMRIDSSLLDPDNLWHRPTAG